MLIEVRVNTNSKRRTVKHLSGNIYKAEFFMPREGGQANSELIRMLAGHFNVGEGKIRIITGQTKSRKLVEVKD